MSAWNRKDLTGQRFGKLVVTDLDRQDKNYKLYWTCKCDCGESKTIISWELIGGKSTNCGCVRRERNNRTKNRTQKECSICGEMKPLRAFWRDSTHGDGRTSQCKSCKVVPPLSVENLPGEEWRDVPDSDGAYKVSSRGRVMRVKAGRGTRAGRVLKASLDAYGYPMVVVRKNGKPYTSCVHRLVAAAFLGPRPDGYCVNHRDGKPKNNDLSNLEYVTPAENSQHAVRLGLIKSGEDNHNAKLTRKQVKQIRGLLGTRTQTEIAGMFGVTPSLISHINRGHIWQDV